MMPAGSIVFILTMICFGTSAAYYFIDKVSCEGGSMVIECQEGRLNILDANFGRTEGATCPDQVGSGPQNTTCQQPNTLDAVRRSCEDMKQCILQANSEAFGGDPCPGTTKYLIVRYNCPAGKRERVQVCEGGSLKVDCPGGGGSTLAINKANYGRTEPTLCPGGPIKTTSCTSQNSLEIVQSQCQGKKSCTVQAVNAIFGDPCVGTFKYLEIDYTCQKYEEKEEGRKQKISDNDNLGIACHGGSVVHITSARYGHFGNRSTVTCPPPADTTENVKNICEGRFKCQVTANRELLGEDPCPGAEKHLEITYDCLVDDDKGNRTDWIERTACEHSSLSVSCPPGQLIDVLCANYGRTDSTTCSMGPILTTKCYSENSLEIIRSRCQDQRSCTVLASNSVFGDPCVNTYKYLNVDYVCKKVSGDEQHLVVCERDTANLICFGGDVLDISLANYGRSSTQICLGGPIYTATCSGQHSLDIVKTMCQDEMICSIKADNSIFGDPCVGTYKYLEISYACRKSKAGATRAVACEHSTLTVDCSSTNSVGTVGENRTITIVSANYGRSDASTCLYGPRQTTSCFAQNSVEIIKAKCEGKTKCKVAAENSVFGDPCIGTFKYLEVYYTCRNGDVNEREREDEVTVLPKEDKAITPSKIYEGGVNHLVVCERDTVNLTCFGEDVLDISLANYGRSSTQICPGGPIFTATCSGQRSFDIVRTRCQGKKNCTVPATNAVFGDPCVGTFKYLEIVYTCQKWDVNELDRQESLTVLPKEDKAESPLKFYEDVSVVGCENREVKLECGTGGIIHVLKANYGRTDPAVCLNGPILSTECFASNTLDIVQKMCESKTECRLIASNEFFGDPCWKTYKYLNISFQCSPSFEGSVLRKTGCEKDLLEVDCGKGGRINVVGADYGRWDNTTCLLGPVATTSCHSPATPLPIVKQQCDGKTSCAINVTNDEFGDPCLNNFKYLTLQYQCLTGDSRRSTVCEGHRMNINCGEGEGILKILWANYGRSENTSCLHGGPILNTACFNLLDTMTVVKDRCEWKTDCSLLADNGEFGDPCPGTYKYLTVEYQCVQELR